MTIDEKRQYCLIKVLTCHFVEKSRTSSSDYTYRVIANDRRDNI